MPITPLHFGPAFLMKGAIGARFSLLAFALSQVLLDIEPGLKLFGLIPENGGLHTGHTWPMGAGVAVLSVGGSLLWARCVWRLQRCRLWAEASGATFGVVSHLLLDALYHADVASSVFLPELNAVVSRDTIDYTLATATFAGLVLLYKKPV